MFRDSNKDAASKAHNFQHDNVADQIKCSGSDGSVVFKMRSDSVQLQRKTKNISRNISWGSKRPRTTQTKVMTSPSGLNDVNVSSCIFEKYQGKGNKQHKKANLKQEYKRIRRMLKSDSFPPKSSSVIINSATGRNNILGYYGLKSDNQDVTPHVQEVSLIGLLDGSYKPPYLGKDKGIRAENMNEHFLHSIQNAFSVLDPRRNAKYQNLSQRDRRRTWLSSASCVANGIVYDKEDTNTTMDVSAGNKDLSKRHECLPNVTEFSLLQPEDILERLKLPSIDLDSLLLEDSQPILRKSSRKDQALLPPFSWSHYFPGNFKTIIDATTLASNRTSCQCMWARVANMASFLGVASDRFTDLESLTYDSRLVPSRKLAEESGDNLMHEFNADEHSPMQAVAGAAHILLDLAKHSSRLNLYAKAIESEEHLYNRLLQIVDQIFSSKMPMFSMPGRTNDLSRVYADIKTPKSCSTSKSYGLFTSRSITDSNANAKHDKSSTVTESCMLPPSASFSEVYTAIDDPDCQWCSICSS